MMLPLLILAAALVGGAVPALITWSDRRLHVALALSTGTFLGAVFLHLLPAVQAREVWSSAHLEGGESAGHGGHLSLWLWVLVGVLLVHLVEAVYLRTTEHDDKRRHESVGFVTIAGIAVHALTAGLGVAALDKSGTLGTSFIVAFLFHKAFESFAVVNVFLLAEFPRRRIASILVLFALVTPVALLLGERFFTTAGADLLGVISALATGTFLYVCVAELLPEVFHHREDNLAKSLFLAGGVALTVLLESFGA